MNSLETEGDGRKLKFDSPNIVSSFCIEHEVTFYNTHPLTSTEGVLSKRCNLFGAHVEMDNTQGLRCSLFESSMCNRTLTDHL